MTTYPNGYGTQMVSMDELQRKHAGKMHPEYARRLFNWIEAQGGKVGIGSSWRKTPDDVSQASREGKSFHQDQQFASGFVGCSAVDLVCSNLPNVHRSIQWSEVPAQGSSDAKKWGVHCNVSNEPWHMQCIEQDGYQTWVNNGRKDPVQGYAIPGGGGGVNPSPVPPEWPPFVPEQGEYSMYPLNTDKDEVFKGYQPQPVDLIEYLQAVMRNQCKLVLDIDGRYGPTTEDCVRQLQGWNKLDQDGRCGPKTWAAVDTYALR